MPVHLPNTEIVEALTVAASRGESKSMVIGVLRAAVSDCDAGETMTTVGAALENEAKRTISDNPRNVWMILLMELMWLDERTAAIRVMNLNECREKTSLSQIGSGQRTCVTRIGPNESPTQKPFLD